MAEGPTIGQMAVDYPTPSNWRDWVYLRGSNAAGRIPDASFPQFYTPANSFWMRSLIDHCLVNFILPIDAFTAFLLGGGTSSTIIGSLSGLALVNILDDITGIEQYGIGRARRAPDMGYCVGTTFKEHVYTRLSIFADRIRSTTIVTSQEDIIQRSRFERIYVKHGTVESYREENGEGLLRIDASLSTPTAPPIGKGNTVKVTNSSGVSYDLKIIEDVRENWDIVVSSDSEGRTPNTGDFYEINDTWCLQDPFRLSGFWYGNEEGEWSVEQARPVSGNILYVSSHNKPYEEGVFLGAYVYADGAGNVDVNVEPGTSMIVAEEDVPVDIEATEEGEEGEEDNEDAAEEMSYEWKFIGFGNANESRVYRDDTRYAEVRLQVPDEETGATVDYLERTEATTEEYEKALNSPGATFIRVDISTGGYSTRNNWYAPALQGQYLKNSSGDYFKILAHVEAGVIDVALTSVDGSVEFDPQADQNYAIMNHFAWMITEHVDNDPATGKARGFMGGYIDSAETSNLFGNETIIELRVPGVNYSTAAQNTSLPEDLEVVLPKNVPKDTQIVNSYLNRFVYTYDASSLEPTQEYYKYDGWRFVVDNVEYQVVELPDIEEKIPKDIESLSNEFTITVQVRGDLTNAIGQEGYLTFGETYETIGNVSKVSGYSYVVRGETSLSESSNFLLAADQICLNGEYVSAPYQIGVGVNTRVGFCGGFLFGLELDNSALSPIGQAMLVSTLRDAATLSSFYNILREEDWLAYTDTDTRSLTVRRGSLNFTEYPMKQEIVIGSPALVEAADVEGVVYSETYNAECTPVAMNQSYDRLRRLLIKLPDGVSGDNILLFSIKDIENLYGPVVSGAGDVNLLGLTRNYADENPEAPLPPTILAANYMDLAGRFVSPVYIYKRGRYQMLPKLHVDIGTPTSNRYVYVMGAELEEGPLATYVNNSQVIEEPDYFDIHQLNHGEIVLIYGDTVGAFTFEGEEEELTGNEGDSRWPINSAVMMIGSWDEQFHWHTPLVGSASNEYQYPTALANGVRYRFSMYDWGRWRMCVFVEAEHSGFRYIGMFSFPAVTLADNLTLMRPSEPSETSFYWRHPFLPQGSWVDASATIDTGRSFNPNTDMPDEFTRVVGPSEVNPNVTDNDGIGGIYAEIFPDGSYTMVYGAGSGTIEAVFSSNGGSSWFGSPLKFVRVGDSPMIVGGLIFYRGLSGITVKLTSYNDFEDAMRIEYARRAGDSVATAELNKQNALDNIGTVVIGSGEVLPQRMSGYVTPEGKIKVFFYNPEGVAVCMESIDKIRWEVADNF